MSGLPADPFRTGDSAFDTLREAALLLDALDEVTATDSGRYLLRALVALSGDDARTALLAALIERNPARPGGLRRRVTRIWRRARLDAE
jgi:hypothetical protein